MHQSTARTGSLLLVLALLLPATSCWPKVNAAGAESSDCATGRCYLSVAPAGAGKLNYFASHPPKASSSRSDPSQALIAMHGHSRDVDKTYNAALRAVSLADLEATTLVIAPLFQVDIAGSDKCHAAGTPNPRGDELLWTCESWPAGGVAQNADRLTSFAALDALLSELPLRWPSLRAITFAGFSAGAQFVQRYIGFSAAQSGAVSVRYVVSDPGTWLYFDAVRPQPMRDGREVDWSACSGGASFLGDCALTFTSAQSACPGVNRWKYGTADLPQTLGSNAAEARARYAEADVGYLEGELDSNPGKGTSYRLLDRSCAANAQGPYRMQRGLAYAEYDHTYLAPLKHHKMVVVPGCAHDVACVFPSAAGRAVLLDMLSR